MAKPTKAQGSTPRRVSRPVEGVKKFVAPMKKGVKSKTSGNSKSPMDGRRKGKK